MSSYDALGGNAGLRLFVGDFSRRLAADSLLGPLFVAVDLDTLLRHRVDYLAAVLGGPELYSGRSMREAHRALHLTDEHMDRFLKLAAESLVSVEVTSGVAREVLDLLQRLRPVIVDAHRG